MSSSTKPSHTTETISDRHKSRNEQLARASGQLPPEVDVKTGSMINPHNPEFITKRPWYLGGGDGGPSLDHQNSQKNQREKIGLTLEQADKLVQRERLRLKDARKSNKFRVGMWVEALKRGKKPYRICQITRIAKKGTIFDLKYDDNSVETNIKMKKEHRFAPNPRIRLTKTGNRSFEVNHDLYGKETYDSKRDKYHGFEINQHQERVREKYAEGELIRKKVRMNAQRTTGKSQDKKYGDSDSDYESGAGSDSEDDFIQKDSEAKVHTSRLARQGGVGGNQMKVTARNLRVREDTAKYLRNLDVKSAFYDPKSRSMRDNPNPEVDPNELQFAGDNFARISGDAIELAKTQVFAWDVTKKTGGDSVDGDEGDSSLIHPQANPSQAQLMRNKFTDKSLDLKTKQKRAILEKYGGAEHLDGESGLGSVTKVSEIQKGRRIQENRSIRFGVVEQEEYYSRDGRSIKDNVNTKAMMKLRSKYEEDVFTHAHTKIWGSYFHRGAFRWGYADDHSLMKNSYCTGVNGRLANDEANEFKYGTGVRGSVALAHARALLKAPPQENHITALPGTTNVCVNGEVNQVVNFDEDKLNAALRKADEENERQKKRKLNSVVTCAD